MRKAKMIQISSLFMIALVILLPVSFAQNMTNATTSIADMSIDFTAPQYSNKNYLDISGTTAPDAKLEYYVGPTKVKVSRARSDGTFLTLNVPLVKKGENNLIVKAIVGDESVEKSATVIYDPIPPVLNLSDIPEFTTQSALVVHGDVSEPVTINYASYMKKDDEPPASATGLEVRQVTDNQVTLVWNPVENPDFLEYAVYRDGKRIATTKAPIFVDNNVASNKEYVYKVSAVDDSCNEGGASAPQKAKTREGDSVEVEKEAVSFSCAPVFKTLQTLVPFDLAFTLMAGKNIVLINAEDQAGNIVKIEKEVNVDTGPPQFITTNLEAIGTTYIPEINIQGQLSEKGTVFVYLNDEAKPERFRLTDDEGNFEIPIKLKQDVQVKAGTASELDTGVGWENKIKLKAVDLAGQEVWYPGAQKTVSVVLAQCGFGSWLDFDVEDMTPNILTSRLLAQGVQQIGVPFTLTYIGGQEDAEVAKGSAVNAVPVRLSPDMEEFFDNDKIESPTVWVKERPGQKGVWDGYVQINFEKWPIDKLEDLPENATQAKIEEAISAWRRGEIHEFGATERGPLGVYMKQGCLNPALGCVKLYLEIDIPLKEKVKIFDRTTQQERIEWKSVRQRNCLPITISIDQVIPPDVIRKNSLKSTSNFFGEAIELIDEIYDPLVTLTENMVYLCMGSAAALFLAGLYKRAVCSSFMLDDDVEPAIAETGICSLAYENDDSLKNSCERCWRAIRNHKNLMQDVYQPICDRTTCPSAPTIQKYIRDKKRSVKDITAKLPKETKQKVIDAWGVNGKVYSGNSCGFADILSLGYTVEKGKPETIFKEGKYYTVPKETVPLITTGPSTIPIAEEKEKLPTKEEMEGPPGTYISGVDDITGGSTTDVASAFSTGAAIAGSAGGAITPKEVETLGVGKSICGIKLSELNIKGSKLGIKELYDIYKNKYPEIQKKCTNSSIHPACPLCCGIEYMWEWNSACGIGNFLGMTKKVDLDTYDELKNSAKLAAEKVGRGNEFGGPSIANFLSGFCTPESNPSPDVVRTGLHFNPKIQEAEENAMQIFVFPKASAAGDSFKYEVYRGYLAKTFEVESILKKGEKKIPDSKRYKFSKTIEAVKDTELTKYFTNLGTEKEAGQKKAFAEAMCQKIGKSKLEGPKKSCSKIAAEVFEKVKSQIGYVDQEYIIKPSDGIVNSIRCICLTSLSAYLKKWRQISQAIKNCVDTILLTGDGAEGMCRSMLSTYVCDLLWEIISCFTNKWNAASGARKDATAGIGDLLGIVTGAGSDIANEVKGRYGETAMFNAMFNEKELMHGLCLLAFGFEWNVDVSALVQQSIESMPVETTVLGPTPCQSRFIAWNPATMPRGLTTWHYNFGLMIAAGADINTRVKLKCSQGFGCSETDGFVGGECDCNKLPSAQEITISPTCTPVWKSRISKDELVSLDCTYTVEQGKYRYDTLIFEYDWYDTGTKSKQSKKSECKINKIGADPPAFCRFDPLSASFRCKFGESPSGIRIDKVEPQYEGYKKENKEVFAMDKDLKFQLSIKQMMPELESEKNQGIKFLGYKIANSEGKVVQEIDPKTDVFTTELKTDGSYKELVEISPEGASWENKFRKGSASLAGYNVEVWSDNDAVQARVKQSIDKYIGDLSIEYKEDGKAEPVKDTYFIDIKDNKPKLYIAKTKKADKSWSAGSWNQIAETLVLGTKQSYSYSETGTPKKEHKITFTLAPLVSTIYPNHAQIIIEPRKETTVTDPCSSKKPVTWNIEFISYDADKYGRVTDQISVDPQTGDQQKKTQAFQIVCEKEANLKPAEKPAEETPKKEMVEEPEKKEAEAKPEKVVPTCEFNAGIAPEKGMGVPISEGKGQLPAGKYTLIVSKKGKGDMYFKEEAGKFNEVKMVPQQVSEGYDVSFLVLEFKEDEEYKITLTCKEEKTESKKVYEIKATAPAEETTTPIPK
ncbi:fibronectin type III domain-containing protein [Candidatus Woesearchaeota archaeon]|nr:fibronectin type III domain-containing protein [Candidatus Woesearchaeota archaeon]